ncbi:lactosylceramide 4-alpha-galactosyltransferase-like [Daphnia carinata]|uniref:lactosylceramide 4-alpha-galactosyltransferase-like n=1 Tax=Daphnia carinata TaxID=120202 RepID=UPI0025805FEF|nr:lactosylceramide 4-alpha-galactosyltransferase-like [Daphnia carinata]
MASDNSIEDQLLFTDTGRHLNIRRFGCLNRQLPAGWSIMKFSLLITCAIYFILFIQWGFPQHVNTGYSVQVDRRTCCLPPGADVCVKTNCTLACPQPKSLIFYSHPTESIINQNQNAFFIETSGSGLLTIRQACAVESLALHNPNLTVNVLFMDVPINTSVVVLQQLKDKYNNIQLASVNVDIYLAGTALERWYHCTNWKKGSFHVNNLSNGLRLLTLQKYGGYYFDLDIISVRPVTFYRNFVAVQDATSLNNDVIHADKEHPFIEMAIQDFIVNFNPEIWGHNGPSLITRVLRKWCNVTDIESMDYVTCRGFNILPTTSFHPVHYGRMKTLFAQPLANESGTRLTWLTERVIGVHIWNKLSKTQPIYKHSTQDYIRLARIHCPNVFSLAPDVF